jgi:hypothetical protein
MEKNWHNLLLNLLFSILLRKEECKGESFESLFSCGNMFLLLKEHDIIFASEYKVS